MYRPRRRARATSHEPTPPDSWSWVPVSLLESPTFQALGPNARRCLDFLLIELHKHPLWNGSLAAPYQQLAAFGATGADTSCAISQLRLIGLVDLTRQGLRVAGGGVPSLYRLTFRHTWNGTAWGIPSNDWRTVIEDLRANGRATVRECRSWLRETIRARNVPTAS